MNLDTICVQGAYKPKSGDPRVVPVAKSTTFYYEKASELADLFDLKTNGYFYTRLANPTVSAFEDKLAMLDGGTFGVATASGMSATLLAVLNVCNAGDNIVSTNAIYGGTYNLFSVTLPKYGIECRFVDPDASEEEKNRWRGEAYWNIAYMHHTLLEYYGPIVLVDHLIGLQEDINTERVP